MICDAIFIEYIRVQIGNNFVPQFKISPSVIFVGFLVLLNAQVAPVAAQETPRGSKIPFKKTAIPLASAEPVGMPKLGNVKKSATEVEDLTEKKQTLQGEVRYAKAKLEAAQKQLGLQTAAGNLEAADRLNQEVKDWQARLDSTRAQLAQVEKELDDATQGQQSAAAASNEILVPGETLEVFVNEDPSFNGRYQIRRGGYIIMPQVGRIALAGRTIPGAEAAVKRALQSSQLRNASVLIERIQGSDLENGPLIYLSGEFLKQGPWTIPKNVTPTLINVILSSGGTSDKADLTRVRVMRMAANKGVVEQVNVQKMLDGSGLTADLTLEEGDVVVVPAGPTSLVYLTGNVARPGSFVLKSGEKLTAYGAILQNGGFSKFAKQRGIYVLRAVPNGEKVRLPVDVEEIKQGHKADVILQTGDIVVVPEKFWSF
ncbi:MAG: polysaccharide biosynthesis/export family protein [Chthoniobacter sp.]|nr:polysaccharide biosynthesis/export family protein [Chthoniobacter sp.]